MKNHILALFLQKVFVLLPNVSKNQNPRDKVNQDILNKFIGKTVHGNTKIRAFILLLSLACFNDQDYYSSIQFIKNREHR